MTQNPQKNLMLLLCHEEEVNIQLGMQILINHPNKQVFSTSLIALVHYHPKKHVQQEALQILKELISHELLGKVKHMCLQLQRLDNNTPKNLKQVEKRATQLLERFAKLEFINKEALGNLALHFTGMGFRFCHENQIPFWNIPFPKVTALNLSKIYTPSLTQLLNRCENLRHLDLSDNQLTQLPHQICRFTLLEKLDISKNKIRVLPDNFYELSELTYLDVSENLLTNLHSVDCYHLQTLIAHNNLLTELPYDVEWLHHLDASSNCLETLPNWVNGLKHYHSKVFLGDNPFSIPIQSTTLNDIIYPFWRDAKKLDCGFVTLSSALFSAEDNYYFSAEETYDLNPDEPLLAAEQNLESYTHTIDFAKWWSLSYLLADKLISTEEVGQFWEENFADISVNGVQTGHLRPDTSPLIDSYEVPNWLDDNLAQANISARKAVHYTQQSYYSPWQHLEWSLEDDIADFLYQQTPIDPNIWEYMHDTNLRICYIVEGDFSID